MAERILLVGADARAQALAWKLVQDKNVAKVDIAPGNGGTPYLGKKAKNVGIDTMDFDRQIRHAKEKATSLVVFSPETPIVAGGVDALNEAGIAAFGPKALEAKLEGSKIFSARFNHTFGIPQPEFFASQDFAEVTEFIEHSPWGNDLVLKADGLAQGKGVILPHSIEEARSAAKRILIDKEFGSAGDGLLIQRRLYGQEASVILLTDGTTYRLLPTVEDHKALLDGDEGPNTGGMGAVGPVSSIDTSLHARIEQTIIQPVLHSMQVLSNGYGYRGALFIGLMLTSEGPKVLEYNCRFGDPETQVQMRLLKSKLLPLLHACVDGDLDKYEATFRSGAAAAITMAAEGYPGAYRKGDVISGLDKVADKEVVIYHAGTKTDRERTYTDGGRVLTVTAYEPNHGRSPEETILAAADRAYMPIKQNIPSFNGQYFRKDIGRRRR